VKRSVEARTYDEILREFVSVGASLIRESITERYHGLVQEGTRVLEPGFIPLKAPARVLIVSYFPNSSDVYKPGTPDYERERQHFENWGENGNVEAYAACYEDWISYLDGVQFHRNRTKPILDAVGISNEEIAWLPFVKAPMPAGSSPGEEIIGIDRDTTWNQIRLLSPKIVWIQGVAIAPHGGGARACYGPGRLAVTGERHPPTGGFAMSTYTAIFDGAADGAIWGWIPEIPGATGMGETIEQAEANLKAGLDIWIETERELGRGILPPAVVGTRTISTDAA